jgi:hypothetical protein
MSNQSEQAQQPSRLLVQRMQFSLVLAAILLLISFTPWGEGWAVFVRLAPEWQGVPNAVAYFMPHEILLIWIAQGWVGLLETVSEMGLITAATASALIRDGVASEDLLRSLALLVLVVSWIFSMRTSKAALNSTGETTSDVTSAPVAPSREEVQGIVSIVSDRIAQQELLVQNMLLDPQAQPVAESLTRLSQSLRALKLDMQRHQDGR